MMLNVARARLDVRDLKIDMVSPAYVVLIRADGRSVRRVLRLPLQATRHRCIPDIAFTRPDARTDCVCTTTTSRRSPLRCPEPAEQQRIADCLSSLDALIAAESEKLDALKTHKKGLMQQLFPSPEED